MKLQEVKKKMRKEKVILEYDLDKLGERNAYKYLTSLEDKKEKVVMNALSETGRILGDNPRVLSIDELARISEEPNKIILSFNLNNPIDKAVYDFLSKCEDDITKLVKNAIIATHLKE